MTKFFEKIISRANEDVNVAKFIFEMIGRKNSSILFLILCLMSLFDLLSIALIFPFLQLIMTPSLLEKVYQQLPSAFLGYISTDKLFLLIGLSLIVVYAFKTYLQFVLLKIQAQQSAKFTERMTNSTVFEVLSARYSMFQNTAASELASIAYGNTVHTTLGLNALLQIANEGLILLLSFLVLLIFQPFVAIGVGLLVILIIFFMYKTTIHKSLILGERQRIIENTRYRLLFSIASAIRDVKIMGLEDLFNLRNRVISEEYAQIAWRYSINNATPRMLIEYLALIFIVISAMVVLLIKMPIEESAPVLGLLAVAAIRLVPAISRLFSAISAFRSSRNFVKTLQGVKEKLSVASIGRSYEELTFSDKIILQEVGFNYGAQHILKNINLELGFGESIGIVGSSGSGKTTLLDLFTGLQQASSGSFFCDGIRYDPFTSVVLRGLIGYVPQSITLLDDTIFFNVSFEEAPEKERVLSSLRLANLEGFINSLPQGIYTNIGENGLRLSGGQRQRLGIARALYKNPKILIFDEATSALDTISEATLTSDINKLHGNISSIIVAHRLSTVIDCDRIYVLSNGVIEAFGSHEELLKISPIYINLYQNQKTEI
jgi:ABC-type multidrug transport system fused ATPase/permease subunit